MNPTQKLHPLKKTYRGFTLVELIVVITILVILGTIAFLNLGGFQSNARDSVRIENLSNLKKGLDIHHIRSGYYPLPEGSISLMASGTLIGYQGFAKEQVGSIAKLSPGGTIDPLDPSITTTYSTNADATKMQAMVYLENGDSVRASLTPVLSAPYGTLSSSRLITPSPISMQWREVEDEVHASSTSDYSNRFPSTLGDTLGILLDNGTGSTKNQPIQESATIIASGSFDIISSTGGLYKALVSNTTVLSGTGQIFIPLLTNYDSSVGTYPGCDTKDIKLPNGQVWAACNVGANKAYNGEVIPYCGAVNADCATSMRYTLGSYFQWGRNDDVTATTATSSLAATGTLAGNVGHTNFITHLTDWLAGPTAYYGINSNLWGGSGTTSAGVLTGTYLSQGSPSAMRGPCNGGYHVPTSFEWTSAIGSISPNITPTGGLQIESNMNYSRKVLKLPLAGTRYYTSAQYYTQNVGFYWSSSHYLGLSGVVRLTSTQIDPSFQIARSYGYSVRCLKN